MDAALAVVSGDAGRSFLEISEHDIQLQCHIHTLRKCYFRLPQIVHESVILL